MNLQKCGRVVQSGGIYKFKAGLGAEGKRCKICLQRDERH